MLHHLKTGGDGDVEVAAPAVAPGSPDYAIADVVLSGAAWGFSSHDEALTLLAVIANMQARLAQVETKLKALGIAV